MGRAYHGIDRVSDRKKRVYEIIFEAETKWGKRFDVLLLWLVLISVVVVLLESVDFIREGYELVFRAIEWVITILFTIEYGLRIWCVWHKWRYIRSFYGIIDLLSILPTFIGIFLPQANSLLVIRSLRLLRVFKILKIRRFYGEGRALAGALMSSSVKILVFLFAVVTVVVIFGTIMYIIESPEAGFTSIPQSVYWAVVTLTTVGYGDIVPLTPLGRALAAVIMIIGYGVIAVPTGIVSSEMTRSKQPPTSPPDQDVRQYKCPHCGAAGHRTAAKYCHQCGQSLDT